MSNSNVMPFDVSFNPDMSTPIQDIKAEVIRRGWTSFRIEYDTDKDTLVVSRVSGG